MTDPKPFDFDEVKAWLHRTRNRGGTKVENETWCHLAATIAELEAWMKLGEQVSQDDCYCEELNDASVGMEGICGPCWASDLLHLVERRSG